MIGRRLLAALTLAAVPLLAQAQEARAWDAGAGRWVEWGAMADSLARHDVVVVGEQHDDPPRIARRRCCWTPSAGGGSG